MENFIHILKSRNETLFYFGLLCLILAVIFIVLSRVTSVQVYNINAWIKPFKFAFSTFLFSWAMAWYLGYLKSFEPILFNWIIIITLGFEIVYIALQASKGELSHYNISTPLYAALFSLMALAATIATFATAYVGIKFFGEHVVELPAHYLWSIRLGIIIFVIFSLEGFVMGANMSHTIGGPDGESSLPVLDWSLKYGDPRIPHFIGMHALQVLPFLSFYVFKSLKGTLILSFIYALLAVLTLVQALNGKPLISQKHLSSYEIIDQRKE